MTKKFSIFRGQQNPKFTNLDPKVQKLFNQKHIALVKAQEAEEEEQEKTQEELILTLVQAVIDNAESIQRIIEQGGLVLEKETEEKSSNQNLDSLTKSLKEEGLDGRFVNGKRRIRLE